jgi:hypothetical protein
MVDDPQKRLERHAQQPVPPVDPDFANRLESKLRVDHAAATSRRPWAARSMLPRALAAAVVVVAGVAGIVAITADDGGVPVAVVDDGQPDLLSAPMTDGDVPVEITPSPTATLERTEGIIEGLALSSATPTETLPESAMPTLPPVVSASEVPAVDVPAAEPAEIVVTPEVPANTALPTSSTVPSPTAVPTLTPATPVPASSTVIPVPTVTPVPEITPPITPEVRPTPTPEREPALINLVCKSRTSGDAAGALCSWEEPKTDRAVVAYEVIRSVNSGETQVITRQRANAPTLYVDRNVESGDRAIYLVRALDAADLVVGASTRQTVRIG